MLRRGCLYWCQLPDDPKRRPVLVVTPNLRNELASDVVVIPASSVARVGPWHVQLLRGEGGLSRASVLKCEQPATLRKARLDPTPLGPPLGAARMAEVAAAIIRALDLESFLD